MYFLRNGTFILSMKNILDKTKVCDSWGVMTSKLVEGYLSYYRFSLLSCAWQPEPKAITKKLFIRFTYCTKWFNMQVFTHKKIWKKILYINLHMANNVQLYSFLIRSPIKKFYWWNCCLRLSNDHRWWTQPSTDFDVITPLSAWIILPFSDPTYPLPPLCWRNTWMVPKRLKFTLTNSHWQIYTWTILVGMSNQLPQCLYCKQVFSWGIVFFQN